MDREDLKDLENVITYLQDLHEKLQGRAKPDSRVQSVDPVKRIVSMVGLSLGEHEEVRDANYTRQRIEFTQREDGMWRNVNPVFFRVAAGTYGADALLIEGVDFQRKIVARMAQPILCHAGVNGAGFAPDALWVTNEVMTRATGADQRQAAAVSNAWEFPSQPIPKSPYAWPQDSDKRLREHLEAHRKAAAEQLRQFMTAGNWEDLARDSETFEGNSDDLGMQRLLKPASTEKEPEPTEAPPVDAPAYCDHCERISLPRRNQLVSMGHQVSHLVELPNEQGYAVPCKLCREK